MLLVFGISFEIPLFVIMLNLAGVVSGKALGAHRPWIILGTFVFAAVATPSTDPFSMLMLALPMVALFAISEVIARLVDRRRRRSAEVDPDLSDDEASALEHRPERVQASSLDEDAD
jgi:sec-independent protein translocase protein TatC